MKKTFLFLITLMACLSCSQEKPQAIEPVISPSGDNSSLPRLVTSTSGDVYLSWVEKGADKSSELFYAKLSDDAWGDPRSVAKGSNWFVNWADFPSLMVNNEQMAAHWLQKSDQGTYDYDVRVSFSSNAGKTWNESIVPHKDGVPAEHGFVSMLPMEDGKTFITWLDGRNTKTEGHGEGGHGGSGAMTLRAGIFDRDGSTLNEWELDDRICDCCQTGAAMTDQGPVVVYRDRSENEIRDMSVVRLTDDGWTEPMPLAVELWEMPGCPVNGPAIAAVGDHVASAWFTAKGGFAQVKVAFSTDAGATFGTPRVVSEGITNGRVGITYLENGTVAVSWMDSKDDQALVMVANYDEQGTLLKKMQVAQTSASRASGFPVITSRGNEVFMAWTETAEITKVKTAKINL